MPKARTEVQKNISAETSQTQDSSTEHESIQWTFKHWLPKDFANLLFGTLTIVFMIIGIHRYFTTGDFSLLMTVWSGACAYVGLPKVAPMMPWTSRDKVAQQEKPRTLRPSKSSTRRATTQDES